MAYELKPGIRQDHRGRLYRQAIYPNGKVIVVPYAADGAPAARMIPVAETQRMPRRILTLKGVDMIQRRMRVDLRVRGEHEVRTIQDQNAVAQAFVDQHRAYGYLAADGDLARTRGDMQELILSRRGDWDWFVQYHVTLKEVA